MPHTRVRYLLPLIQHALRASPIVGVLGQRQTGKTTLIRSLCKEYETLDVRATLEAAQATPESWVMGRAHPFGIDECQLAPALFPALKSSVQRVPKKGQFLLTGSVRFTSRKAIRESLTGRILNLQLLPLNITESHAMPLSDVFLNFKTNGRRHSLTMNHFLKFLNSGGMPGICFNRDVAIRANYFESQLDTLLERDLRLIYATSLPYRTLKSILTWIALHQGEPLDYTEISKFAQTSALTVKKILSALEAIFLIRIFSTEGGKKSPIAFLEDQGMATHLSKREPELTHLPDLVRGLYANILPQFIYRPELAASFFQYRTRGGAYMPLAFHAKNGIVGIVPVVGREPTLASLKSSESFLRKYPGSHAVIGCSESERPKNLNERLHVMPLSSLL